MIGTASDNGDPNAKEDFMKVSDRVASVVAYFPPVDLRPLARGVNPPPTGGTPDRFPALNFDKAKAADYSPIVHVSPDDPPTLLIHGDKDDLVPISNSKTIYEAFQKNHVKTVLIVDQISATGDLRCKPALALPARADEKNREGPFNGGNVILDRCLFLGSKIKIPLGSVTR